MADPLFPDVPNFPGVPPVLRDGSTDPDDGQTALISDGSDLPIDSSPTWGFFDSGNSQALAPDSIVAIDYGHEAQISTFPVEEGGFGSANKVDVPYMLRVNVTKGGSVDDRSAFLQACEALRATTDLYTMITPEATYQNANVTRIGMVRNAQNGAQLLTVELVVEEVRNSATARFTNSNVQAPASADAINGGSVQPQAPTAVQASTGQPL